MVQEGLQRILDVILISRIPQLKGANKISLLLEYGTAECVKDFLREHWVRTSGNPSIRIDIVASRNGEPPAVLERWVIGHRRLLSSKSSFSAVGVPRPSDPNQLLLKAYKRITVLLRTLYSFLRLLPAHRALARSGLRSDHVSDDLTVDFNLSVLESVDSEAFSHVSGPWPGLEFEEGSAAFYEFPGVSSSHGQMSLHCAYLTQGWPKQAQAKDSRQAEAQFQVAAEELGKRQSGLGALLSLPRTAPRTSPTNAAASGPVCGGGPLGGDPSPSRSPGEGSGEGPGVSGPGGWSPEDHRSSLCTPHRQGDRQGEPVRRESLGSYESPTFLSSTPPVESLGSLAALRESIPGCSPPFARGCTPSSLASHGPSSSRKSSFGSPVEGSLLKGLFLEEGLQQLGSLPESPFLAPRGDSIEAGGRFADRGLGLADQLGLQGFPDPSESILSSVYGLSLGGGSHRDGLALASGCDGLGDEDLDLPFADDGFGCPDGLYGLDGPQVAEQVADPQVAEANKGGARAPGPGHDHKDGLEVSSFVQLIESAPQLSLFANPPNTKHAGVDSVERDLLECQRFAKALNLPTS